MKILVVLLLLLLLVKMCKKKDHFNYLYIDEYKDLTLENIFKYSLMIHLEHHKGSMKRLVKLDKIYKKYNLPYNIFPALHWEKDENEISTLPIKRSKPKMWGGAWGLAGSFYKCLKYAKDNNYPFLLYLEDDAFPMMDKDKFVENYKKIIKEFKKGINSNNVYFLSFTRYCRIECGGTDKFIDRVTNNGINGTHAILFTKRSINNILKYTDKHKLDRPIDNYLTHLHNKGVIKTLVWDGKTSDSGMFCGIYDQLDTYCDKRVSVMGEHFHN